MNYTNIKRASVLIIFALFASCATPSYRTRQGLNIYNNTATLTPEQEEVESVVDYVIEHFGYADLLKDIDVYLYNALVYREQAGGEMTVADGYSELWRRIVIVSVIRTCLADSSLLHELAHIIRNGDPNHTDERFWNFVKILEERAVKDLCPKGYISLEVPLNHKPGQILGE